MKIKFVEPSAHLLPRSLPLGGGESVKAWSNQYMPHFSMGGDNRINSVYEAFNGRRYRDKETVPAKTVEYAGRGCYEAYSRKNSKTDSYEDYIYNILKQKHFSVLENTSFTIELDGVSRAATHEIVRHRHFSFCLSGDTKVYLDRANRNNKKEGKKNPSQTRTLEQLWEMWNDWRRTYVKTMTIRSVSPEGHIIHQKVKNVIQSGEKDVYEVVTKNGYRVKSTMDHLFMTCLLYTSDAADE